MHIFPDHTLVRSLAALALAALSGCGASYQPSRTATFEIDSAKQIDDEDIRKAFEARPQMSAHVRVAYYTFDTEIAKDLDTVLAAVPGVVSVYRIPGLMVNGQRRVDEQNPWAPAREVTVKQLRLLAARAHADVLIVIDHGYRVAGVNGLAALNILLVPMLFTPFLDNTVEGYADAFVVDVRNGFLYGHIAESDKRGDRYATIYAKGAKTLADEQWKALRQSLGADLARLMAEQRKSGQVASPATPNP